MVEVRVKAVKDLGGKGNRSLSELSKGEREVIREFIGWLDWMLRLYEKAVWREFTMDVRKGEGYVIFSSGAMQMFLEGLRDRGFRIGGGRVKKLLWDVGLLRCRGRGSYQASLVMEIDIDGSVIECVSSGYVVDWGRALELYEKVRQGEVERS